MGFSPKGLNIIDHLIHDLGGPEEIHERFGAVFAGIPLTGRDEAEKRISYFLSRIDFSGPSVDYRRTLGHYATVSAAACVLAFQCVQKGFILPALHGGRKTSLNKKGILMLALGPKISAVALYPEAADRNSIQL